MVINQYLLVGDACLARRELFRFAGADEVPSRVTAERIDSTDVSLAARVAAAWTSVGLAAIASPRPIAEEAKDKGLKLTLSDKNDKVKKEIVLPA